MLDLGTTREYSLSRGSRNWMYVYALSLSCYTTLFTLPYGLFKHCVSSSKFEPILCVAVLSLFLVCLQSEDKQKAEVAAFFHKFEEAEMIYLTMDRRSLHHQ